MVEDWLSIFKGWRSRSRALLRLLREFLVGSHEIVRWRGEIPILGSGEIQWSVVRSLRWCWGGDGELAFWPVVRSFVQTKVSDGVPVISRSRSSSCLRVAHRTSSRVLMAPLTNSTETPTSRSPNCLRVVQRASLRFLDWGGRNFRIGFLRDPRWDFSVLGLKFLRWSSWRVQESSNELPSGSSPDFSAISDCSSCCTDWEPNESFNELLSGDSPNFSADFSTGVVWDLLTGSLRGSSKRSLEALRYLSVDAEAVVRYPVTKY